MLGAWRLLLAFLVIASHLSGLRELSHIGAFAVFGFYVVSGYLMTLVLNDIYRFKLRRYLANRLLRIFPLYWLVALCTLPLLVFLPRLALAYHDAWVLEHSTRFVLDNFLVLPLAVTSDNYRLVPPMWSVAAELVNYLILWLFTSRSWKAATTTLIIAAVYHAYSTWSGMPWHLRYVPAYAAALPFSIGAIFYFLFQRASFQRVGLWLFPIAVVGFLGNAYLAGHDGGLYSRYLNQFWYANLIFVAAVVFSLITFTDARWRSVDKFFGDLAYPVFLSHWLVGFLVWFICGVESRGIVILALTTVGSLCFAYVAVRICDYAIEPIRNRIRLVKPPAPIDGRDRYRAFT